MTRLTDTTANFALDYTGDAPTLPAEILVYRYVSGEKSYLIHETDGQIAATDELNTAAETIIACIAAILAAQTTREEEATETPTPSQEETELQDIWQNSALCSHTPAEIKTAIENQIDAWTTLAEAKSDLSNWLPVVGAALAYLLQGFEATTTD